MSEHSLPARYDTDRDPSSGRFLRGNRAAVVNGGEALQRFKDLRALWYTATTDDEFLQIKTELVNLCLSCGNPDVKLRAIMYYADRMLGRPKERVELDVTAEGRPTVLPQLSPDEVAILERLVIRTATPNVIDAQAES